MSILDDLMVARLKQNMSFIRLAIQPKSKYVHDNLEEDEIANFLWQFIKSNYDDIDREQRQQAIDNRNELNSGYTKASH